MGGLVCAMTQNLPASLFRFAVEAGCFDVQVLHRGFEVGVADPRLGDAGVASPTVQGVADVRVAKRVDRDI